MRKSFAIVVLASSILSIMSCQGFFTSPVLTSLTVSPSSVSVQVNGTQQLTATGVNDDGSTTNVDNVTWNSSDTSIATVSNTGLVTGQKDGTATVTATSGSISGTASVNVGNAGVTQIAVTPANQTVSATLTKQQQFTATATLAGGGTKDVTNSATWTSSNQSVATIGAGGLATIQNATSTQQTTITATIGSVSGQTTLTVTP